MGLSFMYRRDVTVIANIITVIVNTMSSASEAFRKCSAELIKVIQDQDLLLLAWELYSVDIVSKSVVEGVGAVGLSPMEKKTKLFSAVGDQIDVDPDKFLNLLQALRKQPPLKEVVDKLEIAYNENCKNEGRGLSFLDRG